MDGIGGAAAGKLITVKTELPRDVDGIMDAIRKIILMGEVQSVVIKNGEPIVYTRYTREGDEALPHESTQSFAELDLLDVIRQIPMEELDPDDHGLQGADPASHIMWMMITLAHKGFVPTHLLLGDTTAFWSWLSIPMMVATGLTNFMGLRVEYEERLHSDAFIIAAATTRNAVVAELACAMKGNIGVEDEQRAESKGN